MKKLLVALLLLCPPSTAEGSNGFWLDAEDFMSSAGATGPVLLIDGSAAAPAWSFILDPDTGGYRVGENTIGWSAGGNLKLTLDTTTLTLGGVDLDFADQDAKNIDVLYQESALTDVAPDHIMIRAGSAYEYAAVNVDGAPFYAGGGLGAHNATCVFADAPGTILNFTACDPTGCTTTSMTEGTHWNRDTDDDLTCTALETYVDGLGLRFASTCVANVLWLNPAYTTQSITLTSSDGIGGGTKFAVLDGGEGGIRFPGGITTAPGLTFLGDPDTGLYSTVANRLYVSTGGIVRTGIYAGNLIVSGLRLYDNTGALNIGALYTGAGTGVTGSVEVGEDTANFSLAVQGKSLFEDDITTTARIKLSTLDTNTDIAHAGSDSLELRAGGALVTLVETDTDDYVDLDTYRLTTIGHEFVAGANSPTTDVDPANNSFNGADAWSQATAGQRDGATTHHSAGLRTLQHVCSDRTKTDTDTATITVNGADTVLTESTDFDCEGEASEADCCDNFGAAVTTALGATIVVPDCTTTPGTCYLQFDQRNVHAVDDIAYADGGVNGTGWTLIEGVDGSIAFHTEYDALVVGPNGLIGLGGLAATNPALTQNGDKIDFRLGDDSAFATIRADNIYAQTGSVYSVNDIRLGAAGKFHFNGRAACWSSVDGVMKCGINAGTQGWQWDSTTTDGFLYLGDEGGGPLTIDVATLRADNFTNDAAVAVYTRGYSTANPTPALSIYTGNQTNVGDYDSGPVTYCQTGTTNTDGNTGDCIAQTGASGDGTGADAGGHIWNVNGPNQRMKLDGSDGFLYVGTATQAVQLDALTTDDVLNIGTEAGATIGLRNKAGWWDLQADGDLILDNPGATVNSPTLSLKGDDGGVEEEASLQLLQGVDPYLRISVDDDNTTPALTAVLDIHDTVISNSTPGLTSIGSTGNYFSNIITQAQAIMDTGNDHYLTVSWNEDNAANAQLRYIIGGDHDHTVTLDHDLTVEAASIINQDLSTDSTATQFADLKTTGQIDVEGYMAVGNGSALFSNRTLVVDRDFSAESPQLLAVSGIITVPSGTNDIHPVNIYPEGVVLSSGGAHGIVSSLSISEPVITEDTGTATIGATVHIPNAPTEGDDNYALLIEEGALGVAEAVTDSAKVTTTDALDNLIASITLADGEVLTVEVTILGRERDGTDRNVYHIQGLFYRQGGTAVQQGVSTYIAEMESDVDWCGDLAVSGNDVQITVDGNGDTVDWEVTYTYQILVSAV